MGSTLRAGRIFVPAEFEQLHEVLRLLTTMMLDQADQLYARVDTEFPRRFGSVLLAVATQATPPSPHES